MEKIIKPLSGFLVLLLLLIMLLFGGIILLKADGDVLKIVGGVFCIFTSFFLMKGLMIINPNHSRVLNFFGKYVGTVKDNGLFFINPLYTSYKISLRAQNLQGQSLKVNDKMGNPIEIGAVIVWRVGDTYKAAYEVVDYIDYVTKQSEAAIRHLAVSFPYDNLEDEKADITLREGGDKVNQILEKELNDRIAPAGIEILEARISHLSLCTRNCRGNATTPTSNSHCSSSY
jgi:regulator of protease activity HflC (stomatin/prohibitin superfamily)